MKKKIVRKKRNVKKKVYHSPKQWGADFEKIAHRRPIKFNFIRGADCIIGNETQFDASDKEAFNLKPATRGELGAAPAHYSHGKITPWEVIDDWSLDYYCGNASKYICRHKNKGKPVEDIQKAIDCLIKYKQNLEKETK